eukprot:TRINITY_DN1156_c0_g1_i3.p1 TRINITY_DN1156_c0_g1~~TRINITY_DN1156_c0_g1_i3.p1  ORF type:complete len:598 (-),score=128.73 TRINITY_DN1156_c0_g1_i3:570-2258(-)
MEKTVNSKNSLKLAKSLQYKQQKKEHKARQIIAQREGKPVSELVSETPTRWIFLPNFGAGSHVPYDELTAYFKENFPGFEKLTMEKAKTYVMLTFDIPEDAQRVFLALNHQFSDQFQKHVMVIFSKNPPQSDAESATRISGLHLLEDFISETEEAELVQEIEAEDSGWEILNRRRVKHWGYVFDYTTKHIKKDSQTSLPQFYFPVTTLRPPSSASLPRSPSLPSLSSHLLPPPPLLFPLLHLFLLPLIYYVGLGDFQNILSIVGPIFPFQRLPALFLLLLLLPSSLSSSQSRMKLIHAKVIDKIMRTGILSFRPDQITVNVYEPGAGIPQHVETHSAFEDGVVSLSMLARTVMDLKHPDGAVVHVVLPSRSLLVLTGEARYLWSHGINGRKTDVIDEKIFPRDKRISITFRKVRKQECSCIFLAQCDSWLFRHTGESKRGNTKIEDSFVKDVYDSIAPHFSDTRHKPWPRIQNFLSQLPPGSLVCDVGCGNGKYLGVSGDVYMLGNDQSVQLLKIARDKGHEVAVCNNLYLPFCSDRFDVVISIAVIHHFSTEEHRLQALSG